MFETTPSAIPKGVVSTVLPAQARSTLMQAAAVEPTKGFGESIERTRALDHAIQRVKQAHPQFFRD